MNNCHLEKWNKMINSANIDYIFIKTLMMRLNDPCTQ